MTKEVRNEQPTLEALFPEARTVERPPASAANGALPKEVETSMLADFRAAYGQPPFANDPHLLGR